MSDFAASVQPQIQAHKDVSVIKITGVHPLADLFPMMEDDDLKALAADIKANGQLNPLYVDKAGLLLDGRNRKKACEIANVEPTILIYEGDPEALIWSLNDRRRHMSAGARAMVYAIAYPDPHGGPRKNVLTQYIFSTQRLSDSRFILRHAPDLADQVRLGSLPFDNAYKAAQDNKKNGEQSQTRINRLREFAPDLADDVVSGLMPIDIAEKRLDERRKAAQDRAMSLEYLQREDKALHQKVIDEELDLDTALSEVERRHQEQADKELRAQEDELREKLRTRAPLLVDKVVTGQITIDQAIQEFKKSQEKKQLEDLQPVIIGWRARSSRKSAQDMSESLKFLEQAIDEYSSVMKTSELYNKAIADIRLLNNRIAQILKKDEKLSAPADEEETVVPFKKKDNEL